MEKSSIPSPLPPMTSSSSKEKETQKRKPPTALELVAHYESQGLDSKEASLKVIEDMQTILMRVVGSGRGKKDKFMADTSRKLDNVNTRLAILEMKVDSKPGFLETLAIGVGSGVVVRGAERVFPHVLGAFGQIWNAVRSSTRS
ncbi:uncharacterized protein LOC143850756 [Tasmannia lanceolata]|uniref:uncharacterized protein LOC143850756 n=1 Tax=Tasmannia lanceolata TaxID=3420 RepID=UPI0040629C7D